MDKRKVEEIILRSISANIVNNLPKIANQAIFW
jgi:hypothetical protein